MFMLVAVIYTENGIFRLKFWRQLTDKLMKVAQNKQETEKYISQHKRLIFFSFPDVLLFVEEIM